MYSKVGLLLTFGCLLLPVTFTLSDIITGYIHRKLAMIMPASHMYGELVEKIENIVEVNRHTVDAFLKESGLYEHQRLSAKSTSKYLEFLADMKSVIDSIQLGERPFDVIFSNHSLIPLSPACSGLWLEFGVFQGASINKTARYKKENCDSNVVYGFDTFNGLPEDWRPSFRKGRFALNGLPPVEENVNLLKGLFSDTLPDFIAFQKEINLSQMPKISYMHIDCDLYNGARDIFYHLGEHLASPCILIFDELVNYPEYKLHEAKAFFEFLSNSSREAIILGSDNGMELNPIQDLPWKSQSVAFLLY